MSLLRVPALIASVFFGLVSPLLAQTTAPGWAAPATFDPLGAARQLSSGELIVFDGQEVRRVSSDGSSALVLHTFPVADFVGILAIDPSESFAVVGFANGTGDIYTVDLTVGGATHLVNLTFNYDAKFAPDGWLAVSAPSQIGGQNGIHRIDIGTGNLTEIVRVPGPSGPFDFDASGNLYYAPATFTFPTPLGEAQILLFTAAKIAALGSQQTLLEADGIQVFFGFDGIVSMLIDRAAFRIYISENNFGTGINRVRLVGDSPALSPILWDGPAFEATSLESISSPKGGAAFERFQPASGGALHFSSTDFVTATRRALTPERAQVAFSGPGTTGIGTFAMTVSKALPSAAQFVLYGPAATLTSELPVLPYTPPLFLGLQASTLKFLPFPLVADGSGQLQLQLFNSSGATGFAAVQMLLLDEQNQALATTAPAVL